MERIGTHVLEAERQFPPFTTQETTHFSSAKLLAPMWSLMITGSVKKCLVQEFLRILQRNHDFTLSPESTNHVLREGRLTSEPLFFLASFLPLLPTPASWSTPSFIPAVHFLFCCPLTYILPAGSTQETAEPPVHSSSLQTKSPEGEKKLKV